MTLKTIIPIRFPQNYLKVILRFGIIFIALLWISLNQPIFATPSHNFMTNHSNMELHSHDKSTLPELQSNPATLFPSKRNTTRSSYPIPTMTAPQYGTKRVVVILVEYSDTPHTTEISDWQARWFAESDSVWHYFMQNSNGYLNLQPADETSDTLNDGIIGWVETSDTFWSDTTHPFPAGDNEDLTLRHQIAYNAIKAADPYIEFCKYDTNNDGHISVDELHIAIVVAGYEASNANGRTPSIWGHRGSFTSIAETHVPVYTTDDGVLVGDQEKNGGYSLIGELHYTTTPYMATLGASCHEFAHDLGAPDLYNILDSSKPGVGRFCLMSSGVWNKASPSDRDGSKPAMLSGWIRAFLGWEVPCVVNSTQSNSLYSIQAASELGDEYNLYALQWGALGEYFLMENRYQTGYDVGLPGNGLLIYQVDTIHIANYHEMNEIQGHGKYGIRLIEADAGNELVTGTNSGTASDVFSITNNSVFNTESNPASFDSNGEPTGISIHEISASGERMTFSLSMNDSDSPVPEKVIATNHFIDTIEISWQSVQGAEKYALFRGRADHAWEYFELITDALQSTQYQDSLDCTYATTQGDFTGQFAYRVKAYSNGKWSEFSEITEDCIGNIMQSPTHVIASHNIFNDKIIIMWNPVANADSYAVFRSTNPIDTNPATVGVTTAFGCIDPLNATSDPKLNTDYYYWVLPMQGGIQGCYMEPSFPRKGRIQDGTQLPAFGITASDGTYADQIQVSWVVQPGISGYHVYRDTDADGDFLDCLTPEMQLLTSYTDKNITPNTLYYYKIEAFDASGISLGVSSDLDEGYAQPPVPNITASDGASSSFIAIHWESVADAAEYYIYRAQSSGGRPIIIAKSSTINYEDYTADPLTMYYYWITASINNRLTPFGEADSGYIGLSEVTGIQAATGLQQGEIILSWDSLNLATSYVIYRKSGEQDFEFVSESTDSTFSDKTVTDWETYTYYIRPKTGAFLGEYSSEITVTCLPIGEQPSVAIYSNANSTGPNPVYSKNDTYIPILGLTIESGTFDVTIHAIDCFMDISDYESEYFTYIQLFNDLNKNGTYDPDNGEFIISEAEAPHSIDDPVHFTISSDLHIEKNNFTHIGIQAIPITSLMLAKTLDINRQFINTSKNNAVNIAFSIILFISLFGIILIAMLLISRTSYSIMQRMKLGILGFMIMCTLLFAGCKPFDIPDFQQPLTGTTIHVQLHIKQGGIQSTVDHNEYANLPSEQISSHSIDINY